MTQVSIVPMVLSPEQNYSRWQVLAGGSFPPNAGIKISVPITSTSSLNVRTKVKLFIYEGSILPGHGTKLAEYTSVEYTLTPGALKNFEFPHTTIAGSIDRRDVGVEVQYWDGSKWVVDGTQEWDDLYYVTQQAYSFQIGFPAVAQT